MLRNHFVVVAMIGMGLYAIMSRLGPRMSEPARLPVRASGVRASGRPVRSAGPAEMKDRPQSWDMTDERADESFPASDPPGTY
jgi:hypothetical protein